MSQKQWWLIRKKMDLGGFSRKRILRIAIFR
jgi:hypothetical protein